MVLVLLLEIGEKLQIGSLQILFYPLVDFAAHFRREMARLAVGHFPRAIQIADVIQELLDLFLSQRFVEERGHLLDLTPQILTKEPDIMR